MNYALHLKQLSKGYTGSNSKKASFWTTWAKAMSFSWWSFFFLVTFFERVGTFFFSVLTFGRQAGSLKSPCIICRDFWYLRVVLSARCHQEFSDLDARFLKNTDSEIQQQFPLSYYNLMLISIPFYPYMFVPPCSFDLLSILRSAQYPNRLRLDFLDLYYSIIKARLSSLYRSKGWSLEFKCMAWNTDQSLLRPFQNILGEHF